MRCRATELCVGDLASQLGVTESAVSHQLRLLRSARIVRPRREGRMMFYALDDKHVLALFHRGCGTCRRPAAEAAAMMRRLARRPRHRWRAPTCELHAEAVFRVEGMDCHEEVVILERRLKPLTGVEAMSADVIGQRLHVKYDAAKLTTARMVDAVGQTGMRMWLEHEEPRASGPTCARCASG